MTNFEYLLELYERMSGKNATERDYRDFDIAMSMQPYSQGYMMRKLEEAALMRANV